MRWVRIGGAVALAGMVLAFVVLSRRWPVVNDAALMHYVVFLLGRGWVPYREVHDINLPGAYLADWTLMRFGAAGWRCYDFGLLAMAAATMVAFAWRRDWFAGVLGGGLLALFHGRDGIGQAGQRDLAVAVLFLVAVAGFVAGLGRRGWASVWLHAGWGLALGVASTIKPFGVGLFGVLLVWVIVALWGDRRAAGAIVAAVLGFAVPLAGMVGWLVREGAWESFVAMCRVDWPYHAAAARPELWGIVGAAFPASFVKLGVLALGIMVVRGSWRERETRVLLVGIAFGMVCFFAQRKGYGYQRYPYVGFLLLWVGWEFAGALQSGRGWMRAVGVGGVLFAVGVCAPSYLRAASRASWPEAYLGAMEADLRQEGGSALDGRVQCVDSISGCVSVLYRMRLEQATGTLYDEFLFHGEYRQSGAVPEAVVAARREFLEELAVRQPRVFVVAAWLFPEGPGEYRKLGEWPAFAGLLDREYQMVDERKFGRGENGPLGFRVYVLKSSGTGSL